MTDTALRGHDLDEGMLSTFRDRASADDATNSFFDATHQDLLKIGHYTSNVPTERGGGGLDLVMVARRQRLLARYAPAPATHSRPSATGRNRSAAPINWRRHSRDGPVRPSRTLPGRFGSDRIEPVWASCDCV